MVHSVRNYVDGMAHTNGLESFWAMLKRAYHGTYHWLSHKHLNRYIKESEGRHNQRRYDTMIQIHLVIGGLCGKRLSYEDLVTS